MSTIRSIGLLIAIGLALSACASSGASSGAAARGTPEAAYATLGDADATPKKRVGAIAALQAAAESGTTSRDTARAALKRIAWSWHQGTPPEVRIAAIDALLADAGAIDDTRNMLKLMTPTEQQREVLEHICAIAGERQWQDMTPAIVRSWSREVPGWEDLDRPEAKALTALWPEQEYSAVLFDVFSGSQDADDKSRAAAWAMLTRLDTDGARTRELVQRAAADLETSNDDLAIAIGRAWTELHVVPVTPEQLAWTQRLFGPEHDAYRRAIISAMEQLPTTDGLALRHGSALVWAQAHRPSLLGSNSGQLNETIRDRLKGSRAYGPGARRAGASLDELSWLDMLIVAVAIEATRDEGVRQDLFNQADEDQADKSTEYGGIIEAASESWRAILYPPRPTERFGDRQFVASQDMIKRGDTAPFHYHFHAQTNKNRQYAVPSGADYETAARLGRSSLVFTFIDRDQMNVDLYFPDGALIDLGTIERPQ